ncbi:MAG: IclR family transcriptional regulator [Pseudomonadota bacterium]
MQENAKNHVIQVISRAADILRALGRDGQGLSLGQIAKQVELPRSTVQRIIAALIEEGFVTAGERAGGIRLGPELHSLAEAARVDMAERLTPVMKAIAEETGETVDLAVLDGSQMLFVDQVVGTQRLRTVSNIGERFPLTTTANGKAALSTLPEEVAARLILAEMEQGYLKRPFADVIAEVAGIRDGAIAQDEGEHTEDISAQGFALRDEMGRVFAVSVPVPTSRYRDKRAEIEAQLKSWREKLAAR